MASTTHTDHFTPRRPTDATRLDHNRPIRPNTPLRHEIFPTDLDTTIFTSRDERVPNQHSSPSLRPYIISPPDDMDVAQSRKFSYASVREDSGEDIPQSFESSLSSDDLAEIEWIAWPCSQWCRTKGICSYHVGGTHEEYVKTRLDGYARSNPRKLEKILGEIEKRRQAQKFCHVPLGSAVAEFQKSRTQSGLDTWSEQLSQALVRSTADVEEVIVDDSEDECLTPLRDSDEPQLAPIESLPSELLDQIFAYVQVDHTADPYARPNVDLTSCSLTSKSLHAAALRVMYRHVSIPQSKAFMKFLRSLTDDVSLGQMVHWLDFSHYSNMGFGMARSTSTRTPYLTPTTIKDCLDRLPQLQAFLVHEHIDDELDVKVLSKLFRMHHIQALDFTACSSRSFAEAFTTVCTLMPWRDDSMISLGALGHPLKRLSLHECTTLQAPVFEALLPRLSRLTHLDVAHTLITDTALLSIPASAQITHLNLERCTRLTGSAVVRFLTSHPAVKDTIVYLNLMADSTRHRLLSAEEITRLLPKLPPTVRSLNLGGARVNSTHVPELRRLATQLEELGLKGADLGVSADLNRIFGIGEHHDPKHSSALRYIDLSDVKSATQMSLSYAPDALTTDHSGPLEVIELSSSVLDQLNKRNKNVKNPEWIVRELGRRGWYVRQPRPGKPNDDGSRDYKMGARWWGMRKIPVTSDRVGGMYGYFMFKRN